MKTTGEIRLTRQGVRDLGGNQKNSRKVHDKEGCFHDYRHDPRCECGIDDVCMGEVCVKCGKRRS